MRKLHIRPPDNLLGSFTLDFSICEGYLMRSKVMTFAYILPLLLVGLASAAPEEDLIVDIPGLDYEINFKQYSGYLNGTEGRHLHYWFTESQRLPSKDPLLLWLNGGPGCSSLDGLLTENGPFRVTKDGSALYENPYSWNTIANVLFLESPACVGFSYDDNNKCRTSDDEVAEMNYLALQHFFEKFPEYRNREFFVTGESYGGVYIPTLSVKIVKGNKDFPINFQGYAIGNGLLSYPSNQDSLLFFGHYHGLIGEDLWGDLVQECCQDGLEGRDTCDFFLNITTKCEVAVMKATDILYFSGINVYNIYKNCEGLSSNTITRDSLDLMNLMYNREKQHPELYMDPACTDSSSENTYLNNPAVRKALHIPDFVQDWEICSRVVSTFYMRTVYGVKSQLKFLRRHDIRGLLYNGDVDMACNFLGNEWVVDDLTFKLILDRSQWTHDGQVAGFVEHYDYLDFLTVKGSGHMVPTDKPAEALHMIKSFIRNEPY